MLAKCHPSHDSRLSAARWISVPSIMQPLPQINEEQLIECVICAFREHAGHRAVQLFQIQPPSRGQLHEESDAQLARLHDAAASPDGQWVYILPIIRICVSFVPPAAPDGGESSATKCARERTKNQYPLPLSLSQCVSLSRSPFPLRHFEGCSSWRHGRCNR